MSNLQNLSSFSKIFSSNRTDFRIYIDTNILSDIAKHDPITASVYGQLMLSQAVSMYFILPSILELGFGADDKVNDNEVDFVHSLAEVGRYESIEANKILASSDYAERADRVSCVLPDVKSYLEGKRALIQQMTDRGVKPQNIMKYQIDAILTITAWNTGSFVWSNDIDDIITLGYYFSKSNWSGVGTPQERKTKIANEAPPVFTTQMLRDILDGKKFNAYERMMNHIHDHEILEILRIAATDTR